MHIGRIHGLLAIHQETIGIQFPFQRGRSIGPYAVRAFFEICHAGGVIDDDSFAQIDFDGPGGQEVAGDLHHLGFGVLITEGYAMVRVDFRGNKAGAGAQGLLGRCCQGHAQEQDDRKETFHNQKCCFLKNKHFPPMFKYFEQKKKHLNLRGRYSSEEKRTFVQS